MTVPNSVNPLQANNLASLTKKSNENQQQADGTTATDFAQQLAQASATLNPATAIASVGSALTDIKPTAADIDFDFGSAAALSGGLGANDFLSQALKGGIETKFNELRKEIASSLIAGLAGEDSATRSAADVTENKQVIAETGSTDTENSLNSAKKDQAISEEGLTTKKSNEELSAVDSAAKEQQVASEAGLSFSSFPNAFLNLFRSAPTPSLLDKEENNNADEQETTSLDEEQANNLDEQKAVS